MSLAEASCERLQPPFGVHGWAFPSGPLQVSSESLTRLLPLLTGDDGLPPRLLLLILLVWQDVACEYTFDSKLGHKFHKKRPIWHPAATKKSMQTIVTNAGGVEPTESSTIAGSAKGYSTRGSCEDTGPL